MWMENWSLKCIQEYISGQVPVLVPGRQEDPVHFRTPQWRKLGS